MKGAELPSMIGTSGVLSSMTALSMRAAREGGQQVLDRLDTRLAELQLRRVSDGAHVRHAGRNLDAAQVGAAEADARCPPALASAKG
jgi:hypothetical protein